MLLVKLVCQIVDAVVSERFANLGIANAASDLLPVAGLINAVLQPVGVVSQAVFFVAFA
eukprot:Gb_25192 [translate_table: standard]